MRNKKAVEIKPKSRERIAKMGKRTFGTIIEKPNGTLYVRYIERYDVLPNGTRKPHYTTESTHSKSRRVAQARLDELEATFSAKNEKERIDNLRKRSELIQSGIDANRPKTPISDLFDKYLEILATTEKTIAESTQGLYRIMANGFTNFMEKEKVLFVEDVTTEQVKAFLAKRKREVSKERVYQTYDVINCMYNHFVKAKMMLANPFQGALEKGTIESEQKRDILTNDELKTLLDYEKEDRIQFLFVCSLYTGLRLSDCCLLKWSNVDLAQNIIYNVIPLKTKKHTKIPICLPIHPLLLKEIDKAASSRKAKDEYIYPQNANGYKDKTINYAVNSIFHKLKLNEKKKTFHSLRHTFISNSANNGTSIHVLQKLVGHSSVRMTMDYYQTNREVIDNTISALPDYSQSQEEFEIVRLPKEVVALIRAKSNEGETIADTLKRLFSQDTTPMGTEVENQIAKVNELIEGMVVERLASA